MACAERGNIPALGREGAVQILGGGCANVREAPGIKSTVLTCLPGDTPVTFDGGPAYRDDLRPDQTHERHLWWHLKGQGWMAHDFLLIFGWS